MALQIAAGAARLAARKAKRSGLKKLKRGIGAKQTAEAQDTSPDILSPEGVAMMGTAIAFDFIPPVVVLVLDALFGLGELISWPLDILATIILGGWMWARGGKMTFGKKLGKFLKRRGLLVAFEYIPIWGELPWWTINVFLFLKK